MNWRLVSKKELPPCDEIVLVTEGIDYQIPTKVGIPFCKDTISIKRMESHVEDDEVILFTYPKYTLNQYILEKLTRRLYYDTTIITYPRNSEFADKFCRAINEMVEKSEEEVDFLYCFSIIRTTREDSYLDLKCCRDVCEKVGMDLQTLVELVDVIKYEKQFNSSRRFEYVYKNRIYVYVENLTFRFFIRTLLRIKDVFGEESPFAFEASIKTIGFGEVTLCTSPLAMNTDLW